MFSLISRLKFFYSLNSHKKNLVQKASINRKNVFKSAKIILSEVQIGILEVDFENELGTGQGPTLEFYTLVSEEIKNLQI